MLHYSLVHQQDVKIFKLLHSEEDLVRLKTKIADLEGLILILFTSDSDRTAFGKVFIFIRFFIKN